MLKEEPRRIRLMADALKEQSDHMNASLELDSIELKKALDSAHKISKAICHQQEKL